MNIKDDDEFLLLCAWLLACLQDHGAMPILMLGGEQGTAKTFTARMLRLLVDPHAALLMAPPRSERDLVIAATGSWILPLDNISRISCELADTLSRLSTGESLVLRTLYSDDEPMIFRVRRPVITTGIGDVTSRGDLLDRAICVTLPCFGSKRKRRQEKLLLAEFEKKRPLILGALLDCVVVALKNRDSVKINADVRMLDFAVWATAAEPALGVKPGAFMKAYRANRRRIRAMTLEDSPIARPLRRFIKQKKYWQGSASKLLFCLGQGMYSSITERRSKAWPNSANWLSNSLRRIAPALRAFDIEVEFVKTKSGRRIILRKL